MAITGNAITLIINIILFATITSAQIVFAVLTGSQALLIDAMSMIVDTLTYVGNLGAECRGSAKGNVECKLAASGISFLVLLTISGYGLYDPSVGIYSFFNPAPDPTRVCGNILVGEMTVPNCQLAGACNSTYEDDVFECCNCGGGMLHIHDQYYVNDLMEHFPETDLDFSDHLPAENATVAAQTHLDDARGLIKKLSYSLANDEIQSGLLIAPDSQPLQKLSASVRVAKGLVVLGFSISGLVIDILSVVGFALCCGKNKNEDEDEDEKDKKDDEDSDPDETTKSSTKGNMISACLHMSADCLRSTTTLVESIVVLSTTQVQFGTIDNFAAVTICLLIIVGCIMPVITWVKTVLKLVRSKRNIRLGNGDGEKGLLGTKANETKRLTTVSVQMM